MNKITAVLRLTRIEHSIILVIAVLAAEIIVNSLPSLTVLLLSITTPVFISMSSFAINDYFDVYSDKINKRFDRPIISGAITKKEALTVAVVSFIIGVIASLFINYIAFFIALIFGVLAFLYSYKMKDMLILGNAYIAFSMAIPFIYGDFVVSKVFNLNIAIICIIVFFSGFAREIHGMIRDYEGDIKARHTKNLLSHTSKFTSSLIALIFYFIAIALSIFMFFYLRPFAYNLVYLIPILVVDIALAYVGFGYLFLKPTKDFFRFSRNLSLGAMVLALLVYLASSLVYLPL